MESESDGFDQLNQIVMESSEDSIEDNEHSRPLKKGRTGRAPNKKRNFRAGHERIWNDYFFEDCVYSEADFARRFRMPITLFLKIMDDIVRTNDYFKQKKDALGNLRCSSLQKIVAALRVLSYGDPSDFIWCGCRQGSRWRRGPGSPQVFYERACDSQTVMLVGMYCLTYKLTHLHRSLRCTP
jgi:hypothetical protein